jgi:hypothetical protein
MKSLARSRISRLPSGLSYGCQRTKTQNMGMLRLDIDSKGGTILGSRRCIESLLMGALVTVMSPWTPANMVAI